ncbi:uncharacterized [Tachysurus ichikawai]
MWKYQRRLRAQHKESDVSRVNNCICQDSILNSGNYGKSQSSNIPQISSYHHRKRSSSHRGTTLSGLFGLKPPRENS